MGRSSKKNVYPGIDLVWHAAAGRQLEYDFVVHPGADPSAIQLHISGASGLSTDAQGNLLIQTAGGTLEQRAPVLSQASTNGVSQAVSGSAVLRSNGDITFQAGPYDTTQDLRIDPVLVYSSYLGGSGNDQAYAIAADGAGNAYVTGRTTSVNFPTSSGGYQTSSPGSAVFVTKVNVAGNAYVYSTYLSGSTSATTLQANGIAVDATGDAYVAGTTSATNFPTTSNAFQTTGASGGTSGFVTKLDATGDALLYSSYFGPAGTSINAIAVDAQGHAYLTGQTPPAASASNFPTTSGRLSDYRP